MAYRYLIDGYNLVHALGFLFKSDGTHALEKSRQRLLAFLKTEFGEDAAQVTVVFDAAHAPRRGTPWQVYHGLHVHFALDQQTADDEIEIMLAQESEARSLVVVSNDHRLQESARRAGALGWDCTRFLDHLETRTAGAGPRPPETPEKQGRLSDAEKRHWLETFKDVADDAEFKELFERYPFGDEDMPKDDR